MIDVQIGHIYQCPATLRIQIESIQGNILKFRVLKSTGDIYAVGETGATSFASFRRLVSQGVYKQIKENRRVPDQSA